MQDVVIYLSICLDIGVLTIVATLFNLQLWNFGITFLMCIILDGFFSNFEKKNPEL